MENDRVTPAVKLNIPWSPTLVTLFVMLFLVGLLISTNHGDAMGLVNPGTRFTLHDPTGSWGYDGQFYYYIALDPSPLAAAPFLDVPAYRYQRILFPLLTFIFSLGNVALIPWIMGLLGIVTQTVSTGLVARLLDEWGVNRWYALVYGLWLGLSLAVRSAMPEPLAFGLVAGAILASRKGSQPLSWLLYGLSLFAKEVTIGFVVAAGLEMIWRRRWRDLAGLVGVAGVPYLLFQGWLWLTFGRLGLGSGGAMATSFEIIPFMGIIRMFLVQSLLLKAFALLLVPLVMIPTLWALWVSVRKLAAREVNQEVLALLINAFFLVILPFSTYHDTRGIARFLCALVLAVLLFAARYKQQRILRISRWVLALDALLLILF